MRVPKDSRKVGKSGDKDKFELFRPILLQNCLRNHSNSYHRTHSFIDCVDKDKVCKVDFSQVLKPIKEASNIRDCERDAILVVRKKHNNRKAAQEFRKRERDGDIEEGNTIEEMKREIQMLQEEKKRLINEIYQFNSRGMSSTIEEETIGLSKFE